MLTKFVVLLSYLLVLVWVFYIIANSSKTLDYLLFGRFVA
jgi:hypothetical protein